MKLFAITDELVANHPVLVDLVWPEGNMSRTLLGRYIITERHDNWAVLIYFATYIDEIEYPAEQIPYENRNCVNQMFIGRPRPKYTDESNCISKNSTGLASGNPIL
jgi:hypothetical protein